MGTERSAESYDEGYRVNPRYKKDADHAPWSQIWYWALCHTSQEMIVELGCGAGHFASLLQRRKHPASHYLGIDFSVVALQQARERAPGYRFVEGTLPRVAKLVARLYSPASPTVVIIEVLEHIVKDGATLRHLPSGTRVLGSVPRKDSAGHVRHFRDMHEVCARYKKILDFESIERLGGVYVFAARRR